MSSGAIASTVSALPRCLPPERVLGEQRLEQQGVHPVVGRVLVHGELFEDDLALGFDVVVTERRTREHVGEQVETEGRRAGSADA